MQVKVLGPGCDKCEELFDLACSAAKCSEHDVEVLKVDTIPGIMAYNVLITPALVVDEKVQVAGSLPTIEQIVEWIRLAAAGLGRER